MTDHPAVQVRVAYKRYSVKSVVLRGLDMTVQKGTIYGLLGSSGCGKTTLLSCIVGRQQLDSGSLYLDVKGKNQIGFMPQEISLNNELTIEELLTFYGRIHRMSPESIAQKLIEFLELLELPKKEQLVGHCSGGQQRRISLAVSLFHDPDLLILDEPTVGVDPLLCHRIWQCFVQLVNERGKTIIITTHYIEEARSAHTIGLMRGGVLLAEESPDWLMRRYRCQTLEEVFLTLSKKQPTKENDNHVDKPKDYPAIKRPPAPLQSDEFLNKDRFVAQLQKNLTWTKRNLGVTLFVCIIPTFCVLIVCSLDLENFVTSPIGAVIPKSKNCIFNSQPRINSCIEGVDLICRYVDVLHDRYPLIIYKDPDEAMSQALKGRLAAIVYMSENFTESMTERILSQNSATAFAISDGTLYVTADMSSYPSAYRITRTIYQSLQYVLTELCINCNISTTFARIPIDYKRPIHGASGITFQGSRLPYVVCPFLFYVTFVYTSSALCMEKTSGLLERYQIAGLTLVEILAAQAVMQLAMNVLQNVMIMIALYGINDQIMLGSHITGYFILVFCEFTGLAYGILLGLAFDSEVAMSGMSILSMFASFTACGCMWPIEGQHWLLRTSSVLAPVSHSATSYFDVSLRGMGMSAYTVYRSFVTNLLGSATLIILVFVLFKSNVISV